MANHQLVSHFIESIPSHFLALITNLHGHQNWLQINYPRKSHPIPPLIIRMISANLVAISLTNPQSKQPWIEAKGDNHVTKKNILGKCPTSAEAAKVRLMSQYFANAIMSRSACFCGQKLCAYEMCCPWLVHFWNENAVLSRSCPTNSDPNWSQWSVWWD